MQRRQNHPRADDAVWNRSCVANWYDRQLSENRFHWEQVKHPIIRPTFINDVGNAVPAGGAQNSNRFFSEMQNKLR
jgi:hypothetical protein